MSLDSRNRPARSIGALADRVGADGRIGRGHNSSNRRSQRNAAQRGASRHRRLPQSRRDLTSFAKHVQRLRDQERRIAQEREQRFRAELQRVRSGRRRRR